MRTALAGVVACVACTKTAPAPAPQLGSNHEPTLAIMRDAAAPSIDAAPPRCSAETFGMHTEQSPRRAAGMSCELRDIRREFQPEQFDYDALTARLNKTQWKRSAGVMLIELRGAADVAMVFQCEKTAKIDWRRDHIWVLIYGGDASNNHELAFVASDRNRAVVALTDDHECVGYEAHALLQQRELVLPKGTDVSVGMCPDRGPDCGPGQRP